ncbi:PH domain-containing protein DDB_G0287875-like [Olea europaea var. sylvestris]|uniref:PH domain-containing protein DDB_G0287875-like n=1 Tax=Olea europaea var. sylvestris TaxID=158386 RepID=UPI000C1D709F|nr:PH domain-containing protein DDB_G0287875-like [Olea europaea var. sylvestris]
MLPSRYFLRKPPSNHLLLRHVSTTPTPSRSSSSTTHVKKHSGDHEFLHPSTFINTWKPPRDPKQAEAQLALLRREYARKVKEIRKEYIKEMELQRLEKLRKDEAKKEALRIANEERKAAKAAKKKAEAIEREAAEEEFRRTLMTERAEKLEYWRIRQMKIEEKKKEKKELLHRQSSLWVDESELEKKTLEAIVDTIPL